MRCCPVCRSDAHVASFYCLRVGLHEWPAVLAACGAVLTAGGLLQTGLLPTLWFAALAVFPLLFRFVRKHACLRCHVEYEAGEEESAIQL